MTITLVPYHADELLPSESFPLTGAQLTTITRDLPQGDIWKSLAFLYEPVAEEVAAQLRRGVTPRVVSGDCTVSEAVVAGVQRAGKDPSIVWFDAHGDVHTRASSASGYIGGMPLRQIVGADPELLADPLGVRPLSEDRVLLVGARDLDPPEVDYLASSQIGRCTVNELDASLLPEGPVIVHIDVDVVDSRHVPGLRFPVPDGCTPDELSAALRRLTATGRVVALDLACTWHDPEGDDNTARSQLLTDLLAP
ncbi:arginase family protein [Actinomadura fibrosa]|uniref:Arginase family protein n=1 Tax=Actinomadura fibrosa TaxID=111802 RepID=A0ABW2XA42_9ACTN|nr:arginase family protein [Actinomadura fibrosa]